MRVALQTWGSDGDIRPMIGLAAGLVRRGHEATLSIGSVDDKDYREMCRAVGVGCVRAPEKAVSDVAHWLKMLGGTKSVFRMLRFMHEQAVFPSYDAMSGAAESMAERCNLAVGHFLAIPLRVAAAKRNIPYATISFWPGLVPNPARPPEGAPRLGRALNGLQWRIGKALIDQAVGAGYRAFFEKHGVPSPGGVLDSCYSTELNLIASSGALWPHVSNFGVNRFCGSMFMPGAAEPEPLGAEVEAFLNSGEPPLFLTLGSMGEIDPVASERLLIDIAAQSGERAIVQRDARLPMLQAPTDRLAFVGRTHHAALLPRCSVVLHHGGAGTTHTALAAGRAAVVMGFMDEQLSWGKALERSGVGRGVFRYPQAKSKQLAAALGKAVRDSKLRERAADVGAKVRAEDGVGEACRQLEALFEARRPGSALRLAGASGSAAAGSTP